MPAPNPSPAAYAVVALGAGAMALLGHSWGAPLLTWFGMILGSLLLWCLLVAGINHTRMSLAMRRALGGTGRFGNSDFATIEHLDKAGLTSRRGSAGLFLGAYDGTLLFYDPLSHLLTVAPNGGGKTSTIVVPNTLHMAALAPRYGAVITDKSGEVAAMCWAFVKKHLPASVCINASHLHGLPNAHFNRLHYLLVLAEGHPKKLVFGAREKALIIIPEPEQGGDAKFFREMARDLFVWVAVFFAIEHRSRCNLPDINDAINGGDLELLQLFQDMQLSDAANGQVAKAGKRFLSLMQNADRTFAGVISELQQGLSVWDGFSELGESARRSDFDPEILKDGPAFVFLVIDEDTVDSTAKDTALIVDELVKATMRHPKKHPRVVFLLDEFQRLGVIPSIVRGLYRGRGSGLVLWPFVQDLKGGLKAYGKNETAFRTQADVVQMFGVRSVEDATYLETRIGQRTLRTVSVNVPQKDGSQPEFSTGYGEQAAPRYRKDEVLQTPQNRQFIIFRDLPVILSDLVPWWMGHPWLIWPEDNPKEGPKPKIKPAYVLHYEED